MEKINRREFIKAASGSVLGLRFSGMLSQDDVEASNIDYPFLELKTEKPRKPIYFFPYERPIEKITKEIKGGLIDYAIEHQPEVAQWWHKYGPRRGESKDKPRVQTKFDNIKHKILFGPELNERYATPYAKYTDEIIDFAFSQLNIEKPTFRIEVPNSSPKLLGDDIRRIYLVRWFVDYYSADINFSKPDAEEKVDGKGQYAITDKIGQSINTWSKYDKNKNNIIMEAAQLAVVRDANNNPFDTMVAPLAEALHLFFSFHTFSQVANELKQMHGDYVSEKKFDEIIDKWLGIDEGIVHAISYRILDKYRLQHTPNVYSAANKNEHITSDSHTKEYRLIPYADKLIDKLGLEGIAKTYIDKPFEIERRFGF